MEQHLNQVAHLGESLVSEAGTTPYGDDWREFIEALAWIHDIGKLTEYFQTYINTGDRTAKATAQLSHHSRFGGLVASVALMERGLSAEATAAGFYAVTKHHSVLSDFPTEIAEYFARNRTSVDDKYQLASQQLTSIDETAPEAADVVLHEATDGAYGWNQLADEGLGRARATLQTLAEVVDDPEWYGCALRAWSTLVTADKMDASGLGRLVSESPPRPQVDRLTDHVRELSTTTLPSGTDSEIYIEDPTRSLPTNEASLEQRLAAIRTAANGQVTQNLLAGHVSGDRVFELTLPTGFGKTYTGLRAALTLAEYRDSRVIYALPYTSIIDQVDEQVRDVFELSSQDAAYTKHHHLADTRTTFSGSRGTDKPSSGAETLHAESWQSGLVLTTFTQLFESIAGPGNVQSTKLPALQDAVILVDEPQAISMEWWELIGRLVSHLTTAYDATVVLMTATQPKLLTQLSDAPTPNALTDFNTDAVDLISDYPRVEFQLHESLTEHFDSHAPPLPLVDAANELTKKIEAGSNTLAVVNTVESAVELSTLLFNQRVVSLAGELLPHWRESNTEAFEPEVYLQQVASQNPDADLLVATLTTRLRPRDRTALIDTINAILDPSIETPFDSVPTITVSTQLIEAGVDLSFDQLYRDYAPLPAIVQAAGRCNRRFGNEPATVTIWRLAGPAEADYVPSQLIYGEKSLLSPTKTAIEDICGGQLGTGISESRMINQGVERYYDVLHTRRRTGTRSDSLVTAFDEGYGDRLREASLVSSDYPTRDYLILVTSEEIATYEQYVRSRQQEEWSEAQSTFQKLKQTLVSIPVSEEPSDTAPEPVIVSESGDEYHLITGAGVADNLVTTDTEV